jgi:hypothetical protein
MSIGPGPTSGGSLFTGPGLSANPALDSNGAVNDFNCDGNGDGGGDGGDGGTCCSCDGNGSDGGGGSGDRWVHPDSSMGGGSSCSCGSGSGGTGGGDQPNWDNWTNFWGDSSGGQSGGGWLNSNGSSISVLCAPPSGVSPGCVSPSTRIALFPEGCKLAGEVQAGDLLLTRTPEGLPAGEAVTGIRVSHQPCLSLETEDGRQLHCSLSHEVMVAAEGQTQGRRTVVSALTLADRLLTEEGTSVGIRAMVRRPEGEVVQISLAGPCNLYLSEGIWSHNKQIPLWPGV